MCATKTVENSTNNNQFHHHQRKRVNFLMYAAQQGNVKLVQHFIQSISSFSQSFSLFDQDRSGKTILHYCCTNNAAAKSAQIADIILMAAPELRDGKDEDGFTPLHLAVIAGNTQLITFLLANGADFNAVDNELHSVVHWATVCAEMTALRAVLSAGAPISTPDCHGGYPLHYAAQMCGGVKKKTYRKSKGIIIHLKRYNFQDNKNSTMCLEVLHALLSHKNVNVSVEDGDRRQPLLWAASAGSAKAILALIKAGAQVEASDKDGLTALHCAASRGHTDCLDTLLTLCGSSPDQIDSNGCTALHYAVTLGHADATALLLAHGADPNRQDRKGRSPTHCGCAKGQFETVKLIGARGANLWLRNARGDLPLHDAAASGRRELVSWLLNMRPSQVNSKNNDGRCPIHMAALNDNVDMCKILLDSGASINPILRTSKNTLLTPLDCALQKGFRSTAKFLQLHGGVPASRLTAAASTETQINSSLSFQIRDDVTFWRDNNCSSSTDEGDRATEQKVPKKKKVHLKTRKKISKSSTAPSTKKENIQQNSASLSSAQIIDYNNEIIINGTTTTEINIHHSKEILVQNDDDTTQKSNKVEINSSETITTAVPYSYLNDAENVDSGTINNKSSKTEETVASTSVDQTSSEIPTNPVVVETISTDDTLETIIERKISTLEDLNALEKEAEKIATVEPTLLHPEPKKVLICDVPQERIISRDEEDVEKVKSEPKKKEEEPKMMVDAAKNEKTTGESKVPSIAKMEETLNSKNRGIIKVLDDTSSSMEVLSDSMELASPQSKATHKSFKILSKKEAKEFESRSKSEERRNLRKKCKIPTPTFKTSPDTSNSRVPSLPNIHNVGETNSRFRSESNLSAPVLPYSDNDASEDTNLSPGKRKKLKKRPKTRSNNKRPSKSAGGSDGENLIDSGFEPSPRIISSRIPKWKNVSNRGVNMSSVTQTIQSNIRRYHLERKIFQHLLDLKRCQIRAGQHNEAILVKRAIDDYNKSCASTVGAGRYNSEDNNDFTFKSFEKFLYDSLRQLQKIDVQYLKGLPAHSEHLNPLLCTQSTHRCMHATHAYTGIPCAAYLPKIDHHKIPKIGFNNSTDCRPGTGFLPLINGKNKSVTLELSHGTEKQIISLPTNKLDQNKRYYVTFTVNNGENNENANNEETNNNNNNNNNEHVHGKKC